MRYVVPFLMLLSIHSLSVRSFRPSLLLRSVPLHHNNVRLFASTDATDSTDANPKPAADWNLRVLKTKLTNKIIRTHKKIGKGGPNVETHMSTLESLTSLESQLQSHSSSSPPSSLESIVSAAVSLGLDDLPAMPQPRGPKKVKGPKSQAPSRKPFRTYTFSSTTILVGKKAEDNDTLSVGPSRGLPDEIWLHASGHAGSHVIIKSPYDSTSDEVLNAAALLAAKYSKDKSQRVKVNYTRCRNVSKPIGAKPGLVKLSGDVGVVTVDLKKGEDILEDLEANVVIN
ncbi:hypothetical protein TrST_g1751 [Triparma strigata]|uniref:NFACT RNA-binding domain-containing protein n=1 Tax=Triparma strigata TaxID=1606541 RepID=A0A9W7F3J7_9STRA|nr:hypothetical protein TrST_g1751 [Triparma strigata]